VRFFRAAAGTAQSAGLSVNETKHEISVEPRSSRRIAERTPEMPGMNARDEYGA